RLDPINASLILPSRGTLFQESAHAFLSVRSDGVLDHRSLCHVISGRMVEWQLLVERLLAERHGEGAGGADLLRQLDRFLSQPSWRHDAIDQACAFCFVS